MAYSPATEALAGRDKKPKKELDHIQVKKAKTGGVVHTHHFTHPEHHAPETHVTSNDAGLVQHMLQNMGSGDGSAPAPTPQDPDAGQAAPAQAPTPAPAVAGPPGM